MKVSKLVYYFNNKKIKNKVNKNNKNNNNNKIKINDFFKIIIIFLC